MGKHRSLQHNPNIANTFFRAGYIEAWGRGIEKMCQSCTDHGLPLPEYTLHPQDMMVCFRTKENDGINDGIKLGPSEKAVLQFIKEDAGITAAGVAEKLHVKVRQAERILSSLKEKNVLTRSGSRKNGIWQVIGSDTYGERQHE
jgi:ATP-dependent DNA helicase RecG